MGWSTPLSSSSSPSSHAACSGPRRSAGPDRAWPGLRRSRRGQARAPQLREELRRMASAARALPDRPLLVAGPPALALAALLAYAAGTESAGAGLMTLVGINALAAIGYQLVF